MLGEIIKAQDDMPIKPMFPDDINERIQRQQRVQDWFGKPPDMPTSIEQAMMSQMQDRRRHEEKRTARLDMLKDLYRKIRADNIILDHQAAIELVKMIERDANTLNLGDFE